MSANTFSAKFVQASSQYLSAPDSASLSITGDLTIEMWIKPTSLTQPLLEKGVGSTQQSYSILLDSSGGIEIFLSSNGSNTGAGTHDEILGSGFVINQWQQLAMVYTAASGKVEIFRNGISIGSSVLFPTSIFDCTTQLTLGVNGDINAFYDGLIDEVRIWSKTKTAQQIIDQMNIQLVGNEANLNAYWQLNNALTDLTANGNDFTNHNVVTFVTLVPFGGISGNFLMFL